ncbi:MAG: VanZ family protein [Crocinitomicaceae bacterium]|nr:VanZ family protein [Crocinitomicaceae bacterium]
MIWLHYYQRLIIRNWFTNSKLFWQVVWISWTVIIAVLSLIPGDQLPQIEWSFISVDTLVHFIMYLVLAFSMGLSSLKKNLNLSLTGLYILILTAGIGYGILIEILQGTLVYRRYFDLMDILANSLGTIFGVLLISQTGIIKYKQGS